MAGSTTTNPFDDDDATRLTAVGEARIGPVRVRIPRISGFCGGVRSALDRLLAALDANPPGRRVLLLGPIIHNDTVNEYFRSRGVEILDEDRLESIFELPLSGALLVIPAFGLPLDLDRRLRAWTAGRCEILDTTCGYVRRVWRFVAEAARERRTVAVHGKPGHPETLATVSRALGAGAAAIIVPDEDHARLLAQMIRRGNLSAYPARLLRRAERVDLRRLALANQTTMLCGETFRIAALLENAITEKGGSLATLHTVCRATEDRQHAAAVLCQEGCDLCLVIGGFTSSNTTQLFRLAERVCPTYFIRNAEVLGADEIRHYHPSSGKEIRTRDWLPAKAEEIVLLAGASCPPSDVGAVLRRLRQLLGSSDKGDSG